MINPFVIVINQTLLEASDIVKSVSVSDDNTLILSGSADKKGRLYLRISGVYTLIMILSESTFPITASAISRDNRFLLTGDSNGTLRVYQLTPSPNVYNLSQTMNQANLSLNSVSISDDGQILVTGSLDGTARVYKKIDFGMGASYYMVQALNDTIDNMTSVSVSGDRLYLTTTDTSTVRVYHLDNNLGL